MVPIQCRKVPSKILKTRPHNILIKCSMGIVGQDTRNGRNELEYRNLFFTNSILEELVQWTNQHIETLHEKFARERSCCPTNQCEIKALIGLLYLVGVFRGQRLSDI